MRRLVLPPEISRRLGGILSRTGIVQILTSMHGELPRMYDRYRHLRHPDDDRFCLNFEVLADAGRMHRFTFFIDDTTSDAHLFVKDFEHDSRPFA